MRAAPSESEKISPQEVLAKKANGGDIQRFLPMLRHTDSVTWLGNMRFHPSDSCRVDHHPLEGFLGRPLLICIICR